MAVHQVVAVPFLTIDDGVVFMFNVTDTNGKLWNCGFMHRPIGPTTSKPPVPDLASWVETLKYCFRNNKKVVIFLDDAINIPYNSWWGEGFGFHQVDAVIG
jgi:hypothetical protein